MIPNRKLRLVQSSGVEDSAEFGISVNDQAHLMGLLRDSIYSDKVLAVLREYGTNAWDAHRDAGKPDVPIKVTMPTEADPTLSIRDFGKGLSKDEVFKVYTQYGASTKRNSDNTVGFLGIGSKSAFAYSDSFTIISHHSGMATTYVAVLDPTEKGLINKMDERKSKETGIEIKIAINPSDIAEFNRKAESVYQYFRPRPDINVQLPELPPAQVTFTNGVIYEKERYDSGDWVAVMGCVPYSIDISHVTENDSTPEGGVAEFFRNMKGALYFNIGDVQINASREGLKYSDPTKLALVRKFNALVDEYVTHTLDDILKGNYTPWERRLKAQVFKQVGLPVPKSAGDLTSSFVSFDDKVVPKDEFSIWRGKHLSSSVSIEEGTRFVLKDDNKNIHGYQLHEYDYIVRRVKKSMTWGDILKKLEAICEKLDMKGLPIVHLSSLSWYEPRHLGGKQYNPKHRKKLFQLIANKDPRDRYYGPYSQHWEPVDRVPEKTDVYVVLREFQASGYNVYNDYRDDLRLAQKFGATMPSIYGYKDTDSKPVDQKALEGTSYAVWRIDFIKSLLTDKVKKDLQDYQWTQLFDHGDIHYSASNREALKRLIRNLGSKHMITRLIAKNNQSKRRLHKRSEYAEALDKLCNRSRASMEYEAEKQLEEVMAKYPLLQCVELDELWGDKAFQWFHYIKLVDKSEP